MDNSSDSSSTPLVGFFPLFYNLAEAGRAVLVAKRLIEMGGRVVFFSHGGRYEYLAVNEGFPIIHCTPRYTEQEIHQIIRINRREEPGIAYTESYLKKAVSSEVENFKKTSIKLIASFVNYPTAIAARVVCIPHVNVNPAPGRFYLRIPDYYENSLSRLFPQWLKVPIVNWLAFNSKKNLTAFNRVSRSFGASTFESINQMINGDITLGTDFLEFINVFPDQQQLVEKNYVGIISLEELFRNVKKEDTKEDTNQIEHIVQQHIKTGDAKSILLTMGSSGDKGFLLRLLKILNQTSYQVIAIIGDIIPENEIPKLGKHILLKKFVPSIQRLHEQVDLSIIHGGQGTVYSAAYAGKPIIGFPMQFEQHLHLEKMEGHGTGYMLSRKYFKDTDLLNTINTIFTDYEYYYHNAQKLMRSLPPPNGDINTAKRLIELFKELNICS